MWTNFEAAAFTRTGFLRWALISKKIAPYKGFRTRYQWLQTVPVGLRKGHLRHSIEFWTKGCIESSGPRRIPPALFSAPHLVEE